MNQHLLIFAIECEEIKDLSNKIRRRETAELGMDIGNERDSDEHGGYESSDT